MIENLKYLIKKLFINKFFIYYIICSFCISFFIISDEYFESKIFLLPQNTSLFFIFLLLDLLVILYINKIIEDLFLIRIFIEVRFQKKSFLYYILLFFLIFIILFFFPLPLDYIFHFEKINVLRLFFYYVFSISSYLLLVIIKYFYPIKSSIMLLILIIIKWICYFLIIY